MNERKRLRQFYPRFTCPRKREGGRGEPHLNASAGNSALNILLGALGGNGMQRGGAARRGASDGHPNIPNTVAAVTAPRAISKPINVNSRRPTEEGD